MDGVSLYRKVMEGMRRASGLFEQRMHPFCAQHGITTLQLNIMLNLYFDGAQTVTGLAKRTCMAGANNSALCKKLEKDGFVTRTRDEADERQVLVALSPAGDALVRSFAAACEQEYNSEPRPLSPQDAETIMAGVDTLLRYLEINSEEST